MGSRSITQISEVNTSGEPCDADANSRKVRSPGALQLGSSPRSGVSDSSVVAPDTAIKSLAGCLAALPLREPVLQLLVWLPSWDLEPFPVIRKTFRVSEAKMERYSILFPFSVP